MTSRRTSIIRTLGEKGLEPGRILILTSSRTRISSSSSRRSEEDALNRRDIECGDRSVRPQRTAHAGGVAGWPAMRAGWPIMPTVRCAARRAIGVVSPRTFTPHQRRLLLRRMLEQMAALGPTTVIIFGLIKDGSVYRGLRICVKYCVHPRPELVNFYLYRCDCRAMERCQVRFCKSTRNHA